MDNGILQSIDKSLKVLVALYLKNKPQDTQPVTLSSQIAELSDLGLQPAEIAAILGKKSKQIRTEKSRVNKKNQRKKRNEKNSEKTRTVN